MVRILGSEAYAVFAKMASALRFMTALVRLTVLAACSDGGGSKGTQAIVAFFGEGISSPAADARPPPQRRCSTKKTPAAESTVPGRGSMQLILGRHHFLSSEQFARSLPVQSGLSGSLCQSASRRTPTAPRQLCILQARHEPAQFRSG